MKILFLSHAKAEQVEQIPNFMKTYGDDVIINFEKIVTKKGLAKNKVTATGKEIFDREK